MFTFFFQGLKYFICDSWTGLHKENKACSKEYFNVKKKKNKSF